MHLTLLLSGACWHQQWFCHFRIPSSDALLTVLQARRLLLPRAGWSFGFVTAVAGTTVGQQQKRILPHVRGNGTGSFSLSNHRGRYKAEKNKLQSHPALVQAQPHPFPCPHLQQKGRSALEGETSSKHQYKEDNLSTNQCECSAVWLQGTDVTADRACVFLSPVSPSFVTFNGKMCRQFPLCLHCSRQIKGLAKKPLASYFINSTNTCVYFYMNVNVLRISSSHTLYSSTLQHLQEQTFGRALLLLGCSGNGAFLHEGELPREKPFPWQKPFFSPAFSLLSNGFLHFSFSAAVLKPCVPFMTALIFYQFKKSCKLSVVALYHTKVVGGILATKKIFVH